MANRSIAHRWLVRGVLLSALASGCAVAGAPAGPAGLTELPTRVETAAADEASFALVIETPADPAPGPGGYRTQYVNALDWESADGTLTNGDATIPALTRTAAATVDGQLVRRSTLFFAPVKAAGNYTLAIALKRRDRAGTYQTVASGARTSLTLATGANTATVTLTPTALGQLTVGVPQPAPSFTPPPSVSAAAPLTGSVGMAVTLTGTNFGASAGTNVVAFTGGTGSIASATSTKVVAVVPSAAATGALTLKTPSWPAVAAGTFTLVASGTLLTNPTVGAAPQGLAVDASGDTWVASGAGTTVYRVGPGATTGTPFAVGAVSPFAVEIDAAGNVWVATHTEPGHVIRLSPSGAYLGSVDVGNDPVDLAFDGAGNAWVSNNGGNSVTKLTSAGAVVGTYALPTTPAQLATDASGNVWVALRGGSSAVRLSSAGAIVDTKFVGPGPVGLRFDAAGSMWATLENADQIARLTSGGTLTTYPCGVGPRALSIDPFGNPWVCAVGSAQVLKLNGATGAIAGTYSVGGTPNEIVFDAQRAACVTVPSLNKLVRLAL